MFLIGFYCLGIAKCPPVFCAAHKTWQIKEIELLHSTIRVRNWSVRVGFGSHSLTSQLEGAQRQAETHFVVENIESEFCMTRDFSKTAKCSFFPPLENITLTGFTCSFFTLFLWVCFYFASFLHSVGSSQVSHIWFALMSFQSQRPISTVSLPSSGEFTSTHLVTLV